MNENDRFNELIPIRIRDDEVKAINKIISKSKGKYESRSHFVRCAVIKLIREESKSI